MMEGKRNKRGILGRLLLLLLVAGLMGAGPGGGEVSEAATTVPYTVSSASACIKFNVSSMGLVGTCCQPGVDAKRGSARLIRLSNTSDYAKVAWYFGVRKGWDKKSVKSKEMKYLMVMMHTISKPSTLKYWSSSTQKKVRGWISEARSKARVPDTFVIYKADPTNSSQDFVAWKDTKPIRLTLKKTSTGAAISNLGKYNFTGIKYQVYKSDRKTKVGVLTCKANGLTNTLTGLAQGTYCAKEIATNRYYVKSDKWLSVTVKEGGLGTFSAKDAPVKGRIKLSKGSTDQNAVKAGYSFKGIQYKVYASKSTGSKVLATLTLDAKGVSNVSGDLPIGKWYLRESKTNGSFKLSTSWYTASVSAGKTTVLPASTVKDTPVPGTVKLVKTIKNGNATSKKFTFVLTNTKNGSVKYSVEVPGNGKEVTKTIPAGTYTVTEKLPAGSGYVDETGKQTVTVSVGKTTTIRRVNRVPDQPTTAPPKKSEPPEEKKPALTLVKRTDDGGTAGGFTFKVTGVCRNGGTLTTADVVKAVSPQVTINEYADRYKIGSWTVDAGDLEKINQAARDRKLGEYTLGLTNRATADDGAGSGSASSVGGNETLADLEIRAEVKVKLEEQVRNEATGAYTAKATAAETDTEEEKGYSIRFGHLVWQGASTTYRDPETGDLYSMITTDEHGQGHWGSQNASAIPLDHPGTYTVEEILTEEQKGRYDVPEPQTKEVREGETGEVDFQFVNRAKRTPVMLKKTSRDGQVSGIDFRLTGTGTSGEKIDVTAATGEKGTIDFGDLYAGEYILEEVGWDPEKYMNTSPLEGYARPAKKFTITGEETEPVEVEFENIPYGSVLLSKIDGKTVEFLPGAVFQITNASTGKKEAVFRLKEKDGEILAEMKENPGELLAEMADGGEKDKHTYIRLSRLIAGEEYEIREMEAPHGYGLSTDPVKVKASDTEPPKVVVKDDRSRIGTVATDKKTGDHLALAEEEITIVDRIIYRNLIPGKKYRVEGQLMDKTAWITSQKVEDIVPVTNSKGDPVIASQEFVPEKPSGEVSLTFTFDGKDAAGRSAVAYEKLYDAEGQVAEHEEPADEDQTVNIPQIRTSATGDDTNIHMTAAIENGKINDVVEYHGLIPGRKYVLRGTLMDKATGKPLVSGGEPVQAKKEFTPEALDGQVTIRFSLNVGELAGTTAVAFEELYLDGSTDKGSTGEKLVAEHRNLKDREQTVFIPGIATRAEHPSRDKIVDTVKYQGLTAGEVYVMSGTLMDKATGTPIDGARSDIQFTPEASEGEVKVPFEVDARDLVGQGIDHVVVFEKCYLFQDIPGQKTGRAIEIANHEDLTDKDQTVRLTAPDVPVVPEGKTTPRPRPGTGDDASLKLALALAGLSVAGIAFAFAGRGRKRIRRSAGE